MMPFAPHFFLYSLENDKQNGYGKNAEYGTDKHTAYRPCTYRTIT